MKRVVIITREREYPETCKAYKRFKEQSYNVGKRCIHNYIKAKFKDICKAPEKKEEEIKKHKSLWNSLNKKNVILDYDKRNELKGQWAKSGMPLGSYYWWLYETKMVPNLDHALEVKDGETDNQPYVEIYLEKDTYVNFIFLNRIFENFVDGSSEYEILVADHRLEFIKAICQDCNIIDEDGKVNSNDNVLYIHDKEWYNAGSECLALYNGEWNSEQKEVHVKKDADSLEKWFSTIQVFKHSSITFDRIKNLELSFPEAEIERTILERKFF